MSRCRTHSLLLVALLLAGCSGGSILRDDYVGKRFLQTNKIQAEHPRDADGNPILAPSEQQDAEFKSTS